MSSTFKISKNLKRIIKHLLLNASFIDNIGLMHGKMGISIFFFHLAKITGNKIYSEYAGELIDEIYGEVNPNTSIDFENGLSGIGFGIEYLAQNEFINADTDVVLEEIDDRIFNNLVNGTPKEINLFSGLIGYGVYYLMRLKNSKSKNRINKITNKKVLTQIISELEKRLDEISVRIKEPLQFDIAWDYFPLVWFISEVYKQNLSKTSVKNIVDKINMITSNIANFPKLNTHRLLFVLAQFEIEQIHDLINEDGKIKLSKNHELYPILKPKNIKNELPLNNASIRYGKSGVSLIYQLIYKISQNPIFLQESKYWFTDDLHFELKDNEYLGFDSSSNEDKKNLGLLEGIAGIGLLGLFSYEIHNS